MLQTGDKIKMDSHGEPTFKVTGFEADCFIAECLTSGINFKKGEEYRFKNYLYTHFKVI